MCGISGIFHNGHEIDAGSILRMTEALTHRGPDEQGFYTDNLISLGQRRLSIIDLNSGRQPIANEDGTLQLICNGEIYNSPSLRKDLIESGHKFKTATDVEVILHLYEEYGMDCVKHLRGMFAFALWDASRQRLILARDHLGQKPLFYYYGNGIFAFSSEVKGLLASGFIAPQIDFEGLWHYVSLRFIPDRHSLFKGIQKLPAANWLIFEKGNVSTERYWSLDFNQKLDADEKEIVDNLETVLRNTVKDHLLSDVQVGAFLSGGIDSSTITAMMADISGEKFPTFSIGVKEQSFNEVPYAQMVIDKYKLDGHVRVVEPDLIRMLPAMIYHMDEPSDPFGAGVYMVSELAKKHVKVVLSGDGGDENFAGYDRFAGNRLVGYYSLLPEWFRKIFMKRLIDWIPESYGYKSLAQKASWVNEMSFFRDGARYAQSMSILRFTQEQKSDLFTQSVINQIEDISSFDKVLRFFDVDNARDLVDKMLYTDLMTRMPDHLLVLVDRMAMAHSIESRSPLIDYKVVEYAASIPAGLKLKGTNLKFILKKVAERYLPQELIHRKKQGFTFPLGIWMRTTLKEFLLKLYKESRFVQNGIFSEDYIFKILGEHVSGRNDHNYRLWILLNLELWYRLYFENETVESLRDYIDRLMKGAV